MVYTRSPWLDKRIRFTDVETAEYLQTPKGGYIPVGDKTAEERIALCMKVYGDKAIEGKRIIVL